ncbi:MAG: type II CAAX endopeptidase family protein [bacterium]|nr:type II CAAX endopeptidase family protein [bacterium]
MEVQRNIWSARDVGMMTLYIVGLSGAVLLGLWLAKPDTLTAVFAFELSFFAIVVGVFWSFAKKNNLSLHDTGFRPIGRKWILLSIVAGFGVLFAGGALVKTIGPLLGISDGTSSSIKQLLDTGMISDSMWVNLIHFKLIVAFLIPIAEELFFRGVLFKYFRQTRSFAFAGGASAVIFAALHIAPPLIIFAFLLGLTSAFMYEKSGSLFSSIIVHVVNNNFVATLILISLTA